MTNWLTPQSTTEQQTFPPYNIEKSDDNHYRITLALAGFRQDDFDIQLEGTRLTVKGTPEKPETETKWLHQGLVTQPFSLELYPGRSYGSLRCDFHQRAVAYRPDP